MALVTFPSHIPYVKNRFESKKNQASFSHNFQNSFLIHHFFGNPVPVLSLFLPSSSTREIYFYKELWIHFVIKKHIYRDKPVPTCKKTGKEVIRKPFRKNNVYNEKSNYANGFVTPLGIPRNLCYPDTLGHVWFLRAISKFYLWFYLSNVHFIQKPNGSI